MNKKTVYIVGGATAIGIILYLLWRKKKKTNADTSNSGGSGGGSGLPAFSLPVFSSPNNDSSDVTSGGTTSGGTTSGGTTSGGTTSGLTLISSTPSDSNLNNNIVSIDDINLQNLVGQEYVVAVGSLRNYRYTYVTRRVVNYGERYDTIFYTWRHPSNGTCVVLEVFMNIVQRIETNRNC